MKFILTTALLFTFACVIAIAQTDNSTVIADMYQRASKFYEANQFPETVTLLERIETLNPNSDAKILYLKVKALHAIHQEDTTYQKALTQFLQVAEAQAYPAQKVSEIKQLYEEFTAINTQKQKAEAETIAVARKKLEDCLGRYISSEKKKIKEEDVFEWKLIDGKLTNKNGNTLKLISSTDDKFLSIGDPLLAGKVIWKFYRNGSGLVYQATMLLGDRVVASYNKLDSTGKSFIKPY